MSVLESNEISGAETCTSSPLVILQGCKSSNSYSDNKKKKKKNICRRCGDDWTPGHKCRNKQTIECKIINGKEVQVSTQEVSSDSNTDTELE